MKTYKNLFPKIVSFENLLKAFKKAAKGKRERDYVLSFTDKLEDNLLELQRDLIENSYKPGDYKSFQIYFPKPRKISAAPFRDRIVHHALINVVGNLLERGFINDTYANRKGKGTHRAIFRFQEYLRKFKYVLKCDIKKYFPTIDHKILKSLLRTKIADNKTLWLINTILNNSNNQEFVCDYFPDDDLFSPSERRKGLPIGNLTSQYFSNFYLSPLDHFIKEKLFCKGYVRYVDDFALFSDSKIELQKWLLQIIKFLEQFRLRLNEKHTQLFPSHLGYAFLGQVVFRSHRRLRSENVKSFRKRLKKWKINPPENVQQRIASWVGHAGQADTDCLLKSIFCIKHLNF